MDKGYKLTVGIECHVQFNTKSKLFSGASNESMDAKANTLINHIDFGLPGALPVLNKEAVSKAIKAAFALNTKPSKYSTFDRKHYFYPDLPMGYQITQFNKPIIVGGSVEIHLNGKPKNIGITSAHLEADAGKSIHPDGQDYSLIDLNRAGAPLLEIISEPDMHSAEEAKAYAEELWLLMRYAGISEANLFYGNMRFDVNVSVSKSDKLGTRTETKNLNSFRSVEKAVNYEMRRQIKLLDSGEKITQETRGWNDSENKTYSMRTKENAEDYRYMPDPDLPPIELDDSFIEGIKKTMPKMPSDWRKVLAGLDLDVTVVDSLLRAEVEYESSNLEYLSKQNKDQARAISNLLVNVELPLRALLKPLKLKDSMRRKMYQEILGLISKNLVNSSSAKKLISSLLLLNELPENIEEYAKSHKLLQQSDEGSLKKLITDVLKEYPKAADDVKNGELKAIGFLVGQVMKKSANQANPQVVQSLIKEELGVV